MRWLSLLALGVVVAAGCGKTVYMSHEAQYCSSTEDDDPYYECAKSNDYVCINTYSETPTSKDGIQQSAQPRWLCQLACVPGDKTCRSDEVCCPGPIYGRDYGKNAACVLPSRCPGLAVPGGNKTDAGSKTDAKPDAGAAVDTAGDDVPGDADETDAAADAAPGE